MAPQKFNILLVDDSAGDARLFEMTLREVAPRVSLYWVASGEEALEALQRGPRFQDVLGIDIVLLDLNMPQRDGFDVLTRIKSDERLKTRPVIVMSSSRSPAEIERCYRLGANSYVTKPMTLEGIHELTRCLVRYWLDIVELPQAPA